MMRIVGLCWWSTKWHQVEEISHFTTIIERERDTERGRERERERDEQGRGRETLHSLLVSIAPGWAMVGTSGSGDGGGGGRAAALKRKGTKRKEEVEEEESQQMMMKESDEDHFWQQLFTTTSPPPLKAMMLLLNRILDSPTEIRYTPFKAVPEIEEPEEVVVVSKSELVHLELLARELATSFKDY